MGFANVGAKSMFTKRHYLVVSKRLNKVYQSYKALEMEWAFEPLDDVTRQLIDLFRSDNPNFKPEKFMGAVWKEVKDET